MAEEISPVESLVKMATACYQTQFGVMPDHAVSAPGRVNLIGEHTDYNDGFVLPMALPMVTVAVGGISADDMCHVTTLSECADQPRSLSFLLCECVNEVDLSSQPCWSRYVRGVAANFRSSLAAFNLVLCSSVPLGAGLSSSASLEVAVFTLLETMMTAGNTISDAEKARLCQKAEHEFAGVPCGIMDQTISIMGRADHVLLLDCRSLRTELIPIDDESVTVLITNSHVRHHLTGSEYSQRRSACETAARLLNVKSLRDVSLAQLEEQGRSVLDPVVFRRARHVITEIRRTLDAAQCLKRANFAAFGQLMIESHNSLRDDYEVSCPELDLLMKAACSVDGVYGCRMTGAGFGGCTVTLLKRSAVDECMRHVRGQYGHRRLSFYTCHPSQGASVIKNFR